MNSINFTIADRPVNLIVHDDGHDGPAFSVVAMKNRAVGVTFARFMCFEDADAYCTRYSTYYPFVKFYVRRTFF